MSGLIAHFLFGANRRVRNPGPVAGQSLKNQKNTRDLKARLPGGRTLDPTGDKTGPAKRSLLERERRHGSECGCNSVGGG